MPSHEHTLARAVTATEGIEVERRRWIDRHALAIRITHWINAVCLTALLMSGLQIFNAHPALYWGAKSHFDTPILEMKAVTAEALQSGEAAKSAQSLSAPAAPAAPAADQSGEDDDQDEDGGTDAAPAASKGVVTLWGRVFDTTGWLGFASGPDGELTERGFPSWITLPGAQDLATARRWHFFFAWLLVLNGLVYLAFGFASGHIRRDLWARLAEWRKIGPSIRDHVRLRFPRGDEARHYNILQKLTYLIVIFIVLPVMILAGMTMSPGLNARFPFLLTLFGGRQTARTVHFILAFGLVAFAFIHVAMVILSGFANNMRSMITGRYVIAAKTRDVHESKQTTASP